MSCHIPPKSISALLPTVYVREKDTRETKAPPPPAPVQVNGAKNFFTVRNILIFFFLPVQETHCGLYLYEVNGKTYSKLDMIGKGGSSRVYRIITPSNEISIRSCLDRAYGAFFGHLAVECMFIVWFFMLFPVKRTTHHLSFTTRLSLLE